MYTQQSPISANGKGSLSEKIKNFDIQAKSTTKVNRRHFLIEMTRFSF